MPELSVKTVRTDSVTFVEAVLETDRACCVHLEPCVDGVVWPPRIDGTVVDEWNGEGVTVEADAGATAIGFATPAVPDGEPLRIVRTEPDPTAQPTEVDAWIERVEERLETAESLAAADSLPAASEAVAATGGLSEVEALAGELDRDRRIARRTSIVPEALRDRLEDVDIPTTAFVALAGGQGS